ncbi:MAG: hypothetical protein ACP6IY_07285 [Promethearchaeia archaeon]
MDYFKKIIAICPICSKIKNISLPAHFIRKNALLTILNIPKGIICNHNFQILLDKELNLLKCVKPEFNVEIDEDYYNSNKGYVNFIHIGKSEIQCAPNFISADKLINEHKIISKSNEKFNLKKIYDEFWEFIDDKNPIFKEFILKDKRRKEIVDLIPF